MLTRGFHDALALWPVAAWPIMFSSAYWGFLRLCGATQDRYGFSALNSGRRAFVLAARIYVPAGALFEAAAHLYLLSAIGPIYLLSVLPIYILGWWVLPALLDDLGPGQAVLPLLHGLFAAAFLVLLGAADIGWLRWMNAEIYGLLTGVAVAL